MTPSQIFGTLLFVTFVLIVGVLQVRGDLERAVGWLAFAFGAATLVFIGVVVLVNGGV